MGGSVKNRSILAVFYTWLLVLIDNLNRTKSDTSIWYLLLRCGDNNIEGTRQNALVTSG